MAIRTNVMTDRSLSCRTLAMVASALSRVFGVEVTTSGVDAYTTPPVPGTREHYVINVPSLDVDDAKYLTLIRGYIDHEVGHVRFTDMDEVQSVRYRDSALALWNILEDPYVEHKMGLCYMGCERNLRDLGRAVFSLEEVESTFVVVSPDIEQLAGAFHTYLLFYVREMVDPDHFKPLRERIEDVCTQLGSEHILRSMREILQNETYHPSTTNTKKNVKLAMKLYELLKNSARTNTLSTSGAPDDTNLPADVADNLRSEETRRQVQQRIDSDCMRNEAQLDDNPNVTQFDISQRASGAIAAATTEMAVSSNIPMPDTDFNAAGNQKHTGRLVGKISEYDKKQAMYIRAVLDLRLRSLLQSYIMARGGSAACGKLDMHKLHRLAVNNPRIFQHRVEKRGVDTEVVVLVDVSGSMSGQKADMTTQALYALMTSLSRIKGVRAGAFGFNSDSFPCYVPMGGAVTDDIRICPSGGTLLGEGINSCLSRFNYDEGSRQVLIILSDGDSQNHNYVRHMFKKTKDIGVEVAAIGILDNYIMQYKDVADCRVIKDLKELPSTLFSILQDKLVVGGLR